MRIDSTGVRRAKHSDNSHRSKAIPPILSDRRLKSVNPYPEFNIYRHCTQLRPAFANCLDSLRDRDMTLLGSEV